MLGMRAEYGMGSRKYFARNRWRRARMGLLQKELWDSFRNLESTGCLGQWVSGKWRAIVPGTLGMRWAVVPPGQGG